MGNPADLPDRADFEQYVTQADVDRDPFAIALFEIKPIDLDDSDLLFRLGQTLLQFASPTTQIAYLSRNRFGLLSHTDDTTHRWIAPVTTALRATLDRWCAEEWPDVDAAAAPNPHGNALGRADQPTLNVGVARGLDREVWVNAEQAMAKAHKQRIPMAEHQISDRRNTASADLAGDPRREISSSLRDLTEPKNSNNTPSLDDDQLTVLSRRIEPVDRPEPLWHWLRLVPAVRASATGGAIPIQLNDLALRDQARVEVWLADQVADLFAEASVQLRISIPLSAEACQARSFAQHIFPLLERYRVPPSRLVAEIDMSVISRVDLSIPDALLPPSAPSVEQFIRDAAAVNVGVAVTGFNGGWSAWHNLADLPVNYLIPSPEMIHQAGRGDDRSIRALVLLASDAEERDIELVAPELDSGLSEHALTQLGFTYREGPLDDAMQALATPTRTAESAT